MSDIMQESLDMHKKHKGKIEITSKVPLETKKDLSLYYTPGVAQPCKEIHKTPSSVYDYTSKGNLVAVISDGSAVLGLGNLGASAAIPVMEGKCVLFKKFADVDAFPICIESQDSDTIINTVKQIAPVFGGINLEDISAPRCFEIEKQLKEQLDIPIFHDDQHGTAIVVAASIINSLKIVKKNMKDLKITICGAGAAGIAVTKILINLGAGDIILCDSKGIISKDRTDLNPAKIEICKTINKSNLSGSLKDAIEGADVLIGVSAPSIVTEQMIKTMNKDAIVFAMSNPLPEIMPDLAKKAGARIIGTGRSDYPNQINNVLAFPAVFRGALDARATEINEDMKLAAARALANCIPETQLKEDYIIPSPQDPSILTAVSEAVKKAAQNTGAVRR
ncbi:MAG: NAD-dependent malic enzyme [Candidatus Nanohalarchaeota archaeon]|nr:MAG: NAD-dependent malic enzyme [Candidatus Nanohaloarchaeota archaeon]